jgi:molybdopterin-guanine dinucleotide biosynthesis protein B
MRVFSVTGLTSSGKTTTIENIIKELKKRGYTVGTVKEIHYDAFQIDTEGKNTYRHRQAGANTVVARSNKETDVMYVGKKDIYDILSHFEEDFVILEGVRDAIVPEICVSKEDIMPDISPLSFVISGRYANNHNTKFDSLPILNSLKNIGELCDLIEDKVPDLMPNVEEECCGKCGTCCKDFLSKYLKNEITMDKCVLQNKIVNLQINDKEIVIVPFVQSLIKNIVIGVTSELKGYKKDANIKIEIK